MSSHLIRSDLVPVLSGYLLLMGALGAGLLTARRLVRRYGGQPLTRRTGWWHPRGTSRGWPAVIWHVAADALGGYLLLMAVVVGYYYGIARVGSNFLASAFSGAAVLIAIALPLGLAASWLARRRAAGAGGRNARRCVRRWPYGHDDDKT